MPADTPNPPAAAPGGYHRIRYLQFEPGGALPVLRRAAGWLTWPVILPLALASRASDIIFRTISEFLSLVPYAIGIIVRAEFYRFALRACGRNVVTELGTVFCYRNVTVGNHVLLGRFTIVHLCDIGDYVVAGERCTFLSGTRQHGVDRTDIPMALQDGFRKHIRIGDDCWIGSHAVVAEDVGTGAVVGAGSVVVQPVEPRMIVAGNPARPIRLRKASPAPSDGTA